MSASERPIGIIKDMPSNEYHAVKGTYSSSQLKDILDDEEIFYKKYISKELEKESIPAFDIGTYFHTAILEPHKLKSECKVYRGIRRGKEWDRFQEENRGLAIITEAEESQAIRLIDAVKNSPISMNRIKRGEAEVSAFVDVIVYLGEIYSSDGKWVLGAYGWNKATEKINKKSSMLLPLKVRADLLGGDFILDLKSMTGNAKSPFATARRVSEYCYDLSAAMYLDLFTLATGELKSEFIWTFASKDLGNCRSYMASANNILIGRHKWRKAVLKLASCIETNWEFEDYLAILEPQAFELADFKQRTAEDLL
jgi:hypothetical protein